MGQFGPEWDECDDIDEPRAAGTRSWASGGEKIFEVRTDPQRRDLHRHVPDARVLPGAPAVLVQVYQEPDEQLRDREPRVPEDQAALLNSLTNFGKPLIYVLDGNYRNRGELYLARTISPPASSSSRTTPRTRSTNLRRAVGAARSTSRRSSAMRRRSFPSTERGTRSAAWARRKLEIRNCAK